jgi:hypothetical protein
MRCTNLISSILYIPTYCLHILLSTVDIPQNHSLIFVFNKSEFTWNLGCAWLVNIFLKSLLKIAPQKYGKRFFQDIYWQILRLPIGIFNFRFSATITSCSAGSQTFFLDKKSETNQKNFCSGKIKALWEIRDFRKITTYMSYIVNYLTDSMQFSSFSTFSVLALAEDVLRDLTWARLQKNLRLVKNFLRSQMKLLYSKSKKLEYRYFWQICANLGQIWTHNWYFWIFDFLPKSQGALRDLTWARLQKNLRLVKNFLRSQMKLLYSKSKKLECRDFWQICANLGQI